MYTYETEFARWKFVGNKLVDEEHITIRFTHYRPFERLPESGKALENFVDKAWKALFADPRGANKPGWSSWVGAHKFKRIMKGN